jgi:hypothetical protein
MGEIKAHAIKLSVFITILRYRGQKKVNFARVITGKVIRKTGISPRNYNTVVPNRHRDVHAHVQYMLAE